MYGVNTSIFTRPVDGSGRWRHIPGLLKHVTASGRNEIYGTNTADQIWWCKKPCVGDRKSTEEALMQCDTTISGLFRVNSGHVIFRRVTGI